jgi:hypothetical protein
VRIMKQLVPEYISNNSLFEKLDQWLSLQKYKYDSPTSIS